jgi:peptide chain release factor 1
MFDKLDSLEARFEELDELMGQPDTDPKKLVELSQERSSLEDVVTVYRDFKKTNEELEQARELLKSGETDSEMRGLAQQEVQELEEAKAALESKLQLLLLPKDPRDDKNVILEIRAGAGGDEASLFAGDLYRMYQRYAEERGYRVELLEAHEGTAGGFKQITATVKGKGAFSRLKFEGGVHRVQRVPSTETQGRVHTSTATVAVLPEVEEVDVDINPSDLRIDVYRSSGPGGQSVNTTDSAVRITHIPTGIVVSMQDEKSQHKNKDKAMRVLRSRIFDAELEKQQSEVAAERKSMVGSGDRAEKIRTYNFPQNRVTDHRINLTVHKLDQVIDGKVDELIEPLLSHSQAEALKSQSDEASQG